MISGPTPAASPIVMPMIGGSFRSAPGSAGDAQRRAARCQASGVAECARFRTTTRQVRARRATASASRLDFREELRCRCTDAEQRRARSRRPSRSGRRERRRAARRAGASVRASAGPRSGRARSPPDEDAARRRRRDAMAATRGPVRVSLARVAAAARWRARSRARRRAAPAAPGAGDAGQRSRPEAVPAPAGRWPGGARTRRVRPKERAGSSRARPAEPTHRCGRGGACRLGDRSRGRPPLGVDDHRLRSRCELPPASRQAPRCPRARRAAAPPCSPAPRRISRQVRARAASPACARSRSRRAARRARARGRRACVRPVAGNAGATTTTRPRAAC